MIKFVGYVFIDIFSKNTKMSNGLQIPLPLSHMTLLAKHVSTSFRDGVLRESLFPRLSCVIQQAK